jgi:hypothetical protein
MPECCGGAALLPSSEGAPIPKCKEGATATYRCDSVVVRLNAAAATVMAARKIPTVDLHKTVTDVSQVLMCRMTCRLMYFHVTTHFTLQGQCPQPHS